IKLSFSRETEGSSSGRRKSMNEEALFETPGETRRRFEEAGQEKTFRFFGDLSRGERKKLLEQATQLDLDELTRAWSEICKSGKKRRVSGLEPAPCISLPGTGQESLEWRDAQGAGEEAIAAGRVAAFTVAGGQGTRLGFPGPKGEFPGTPLSRKPLFQLFAETILAAERRYACSLHWFIMTSEANHRATQQFFDRNNHFGLSENRLHFFRQGMMPAVDESGCILLESRSQIALSPDGHGGSFKALVSSGAAQTMRDEGICTVSYFQVDNPLVRCLDPVFLGYHFLRKSEMTSKTAPKTGPDEKVGIFCLKEDKLVVIEYSDLPENLAHERNPDGVLRFGAGSIAIHAIDREFIEKVGDPSYANQRLPFHGARKKVPTVDKNGELQIPSEPNATKLETFVFDALPLAANPLVVETSRTEEFAPIKNANGEDSPSTAYAAQFARARNWASLAGIENPPEKFEVAPSFATSSHEFRENWHRRPAALSLALGLVLNENHLVHDA
ncbi:MAG: UDPGP type 1 family protein, partial [Opitutales bacterium]